MHRSFAPVLFAFCGAILACSLCSAADLMIADAAEAENWTLVETSLRDVDPDDAQSDGMTALHWAVYHGHIARPSKNWSLRSVPWMQKRDTKSRRCRSPALWDTTKLSKRCLMRGLMQIASNLAG